MPPIVQRGDRAVNLFFAKTVMTISNDLIAGTHHVELRLRPGLFFFY